LKAFCGGSFRSGGEIFAEFAQLKQRIQNADLVITGEGSTDPTMLMGKGVGIVAKAAAAAGKRCLCLAGSVSIDPASVPWPDFKAYAIVPSIASLEESQARPEECLSRLAAHAAKEA
jgi:glycerate 2-kinase